MPKDKDDIPHWWTIFATEYMMNGQCASHACLKAKPHLKPESAAVEAHRLLSDVNFKAFLASFRQTCTERMGMKWNEWMGNLMDCARFDLTNFLTTERMGPDGETIPLSGDIELDPNWNKRPDKHVIQEVQMTTTTLENGQVVQKVKLTAAKKLEALRIIGAAQGFLEEKQAPSGSLSSEEVLALLLKVNQLTNDQKSKLKELPDMRTIDIEVVE